MSEISEADIRLLTLLQQDAKSSTGTLAEAAGMSASPAWRRVRRLEEKGVIESYVALVNRNLVGLDTLAYVHISLLEHSEESIRKFDDFVTREGQVIECCSITGADDYLLKVVAKTPEHLEEFLMKKVLKLGIVRNTTTHFVLRQKKYTTALPV